MNDSDWLISSPNVDMNLFGKKFGKQDEILWAFKNDLPLNKTVSCNISTEATEFKNCGNCNSCFRRMKSFEDAGVEDETEYYIKVPES